MAMAQSSSCPNPDLSNCAIVHSPQSVSSNLDTQRERGIDEGEEEEDEVELAEEVGEDALMMGEAEEEQDEQESEDDSERDNMMITEVVLLPNGATKEGEGRSETREENVEGAVEAEEKDQEKINEQTKELSEAMTEDETEDQWDFSPLTPTEKDEDMKNEEYKQETLSWDTDVREEQINEGDSRLDDHQRVSTFVDAETAEELNVSAEEATSATQLSTDDTSTTSNAVLSGHNETEVLGGSVTREGSITTAADGEVTLQLDQRVLFDTVEVSSTDSQTVQLTSENLDKMKDADEIDSESSIQLFDTVTWQQTDLEQTMYATEVNNELVDHVKSASNAVLDTEADTNLEETQPQLDFVPLEALSQTKGGIEQISLEGINQKAHEEEQVRQVGVNTLIGTDGGGKTTEEKWKACDNVVSELMDKDEHRRKCDKGMNEESTCDFEKQAMVALEPAVQCAEVKQDVDLDQVEEAFELEEHCEVELAQTEGEVISHEKESTAEEGDITIQHEHESEELEEAMVEEVEMAEEPVTVLDDEIEETEESQASEEQEPAQSEERTLKTKDTEFQELEEKDEKQTDEKETAENDKKLKDDIREVELDINGKVNKLRKAMENGIFCPEPHPLKKEGWGTAKVRLPRRKDNDWIKNDEPQDNGEVEVKDWRKELKPVKKDWEHEGGRKEWVKKDSPPGDKASPKKEDWIKELKSVIKDESLPKKRGEQGKKKRVVLLEDGHSYIPQREEITEEKKEEVKLISHKRVESPLPYVRRNSKTPQDQEYEISLYVKVKDTTKIVLTKNICSYISIHFIYSCMFSLVLARPMRDVD